MNYTIQFTLEHLGWGGPSPTIFKLLIMDSLKFIETMSVAVFRIKKGVERLDMKLNSNIGKYFLCMVVK